MVGCKRYVLGCFIGFLPVCLWAQVHVCATCKYKDLALAVEQSAAYDTLWIHEGRYEVANLRITKPLLIKGKGKAVLDGGGKHEILFVQGQDIHIEGLYFQGVGQSALKELAAIHVYQAQGISLINNTIQSHAFGILMEKTKNSRISYNAIKGYAEDEFNAGNGIHLWYCDDIDITFNLSLIHI